MAKVFVLCMYTIQNLADHFFIYPQMEASKLNNTVLNATQNGFTNWTVTENDTTTDFFTSQMFFVPQGKLLSV